MKYRWLRRKRVWIPAAAALLGITVWAWAVWSSPFTDLSQLPSKVVPPSADSLLSAPCYGTRVRFESSAKAAYARAGREDRLVLLLHLSGRFGSSETT